jgi:hypothetical protein
MVGLVGLGVVAPATLAELVVGVVVEPVGGLMIEIRVSMVVVFEVVIVDGGVVIAALDAEALVVVAAVRKAGVITLTKVTSKKTCGEVGVAVVVVVGVKGRDVRAIGVQALGGSENMAIVGMVTVVRAVGMIVVMAIAVVFTARGGAPGGRARRGGARSGRYGVAGKKVHRAAVLEVVATEVVAL